MHALFNGGVQSTVVESQTLADGLTGAVEGGSLTIPLVRQFIQNILLVSEESIARAVAFAWSEYGQVIEPSAAVSLAAVLDKMVKPPLIVVISGGNIDSQVHAEIVEKCSG
jgi:threonine dehydratase